LNLGSRGEPPAQLFFLEARIVGGDAPFPWVGAVGLAFLLGREALNPLPSLQSCGGVLVDGMSVDVRQGGCIRYQPTRASAAAWRVFMDRDSIGSVASGRSLSS
jgi:hypothetical protein